MLEPMKGQEWGGALGPISPELMLVSPPELAQRAREQLPDPPDVFARRPSVALGEPFDWRTLLSAPEQPEPVKPKPRPSRIRRWRGKFLAVGIVSAVLAGGAYASIKGPDQAPTLLPKVRKVVTPRQTRQVPAIVKKVKGRQRVARPPRVTKVPLLSWARQANESRYWFQLAEVGAKRDHVVLTSVTRGTHFRARGLKPGRYRWYVWPGSRITGSGPYGPTIAQGQFTIR